LSFAACQAEPARPDCALGRGSGYEQAKAKLRRLESDEVAVTFGPSTGCEVITEAAHCPLFGLRPNPGPHGYSATYMIVQVCLGPAPVGLEEAVSAVPRYSSYWVGRVM
jgi:hypothetical protein